MWAAAGNFPSFAEVLDRAEAYLSTVGKRRQACLATWCGSQPIFGELFSFRMGFQEMEWTMTDLVCLKDH